MPARKGFSTRAIHAELKVPKIASRAVAVPIFQTASFAFDDPEGMAETLHDPGAGFMYSRVANPTIDALERAVADLEEAEAATATASGMAAVHGALTALLSAGDHAVVQAGVYGNTYALFKNVL